MFGLVNELPTGIVFRQTPNKEVKAHNLQVMALKLITDSGRVEVGSYQSHINDKLYKLIHVYGHESLDNLLYGLKSLLLTNIDELNMQLIKDWIIETILLKFSYTTSSFIHPIPWYELERNIDEVSPRLIEIIPLFYKELIERILQADILANKEGKQVFDKVFKALEGHLIPSPTKDNKQQQKVSFTRIIDKLTKADPLNFSILEDNWNTLVDYYNELLSDTNITSKESTPGQVSRGFFRPKTETGRASSRWVNLNPES